jgi:hypothetical protein
MSERELDWNDENTMKPVRSPEALTTERKNQHGDWTTQAEMANRLKEQLRRSPNWGGMVPMQKEALDMIATKMSRIVAGDPMHDDHWDDISGYAFLGKGGHSGPRS